MTEQLLIRLRKIADTDYEIFPLLKQRYSPHVFKKERIEDGHIKKMFEAARWSASTGNMQPCRFLYGQRGTAAFGKIVDCLTDEHKEWAASAPLLILTSCQEKTESAEKNCPAMYDLGLSIGNMTVQAQYMGVALHNLTTIDRQKARKLFKIPETCKIASVIAAGYYGGDVTQLSESLQHLETEARTRKPQSEFVFEDKWQQ